jgi:choline dehydrogenase-like flavoprotein
MTADLEADYVIIGGGTAGCILAARLSENPATRVIVLEAGHEGRGLLYDIPAGSFALMGNPKADWIYPTAPDSSALGRSTTWAADKVLGGSSGINGMVYIRGQRGRARTDPSTECRPCLEAPHRACAARRSSRSRFDDPWLQTRCGGISS